MDFRNPTRRLSNEELWEANERALIRDAIAETEQEIVDDALDLAPDDDDGDMSLEEVEGWDGENLSDFEVAHTALSGFNEESNYDRQVALAADRELLGEVQRLRQERDAARADYDREFNAPERVAAMQAQIREGLYQRYGVLGTDDARTNQLISEIAAQQAHVSALNEHRISRSMSEAESAYGDDFREAFAAAQRAAATGSPDARAVINGILNQPDPGLALMRAHYGNFDTMGRTSDAFTDRYGYMGARAAPSRSRGRDISDDVAGSFGNEAIEREIADSVWD